MEELVFTKYPKIRAVYKRDMGSPDKHLTLGEFSFPELEYLQKNQWELTEKVDGTNVRVMWDGDSFKFGGRTNNAQMPVALMEELTRSFKHDLFRKSFKEDSKVIVYGEGYGGNIQKMGSLYSTDIKFVVFDILIGHFWLERSSILEICEQVGLNVVPLLGRSTLQEAIHRVTQGIQSAWRGFEAEGVVARPVIGLMARNGQRVITKIKGKDFYR